MLPQQPRCDTHAARAGLSSSPLELSSRGALRAAALSERARLGGGGWARGLLGELLAAGPRPMGAGLQGAGLHGGARGLLGRMGARRATWSRAGVPKWSSVSTA